MILTVDSVGVPSLYGVNIISNEVSERQPPSRANLHDDSVLYDCVA